MCRPVIYIENHCVKGSAELIWALAGMGGGKKGADYRLYWDVQPYFNPGNHFRNKANIFPNGLAVNIVAVPRLSKYVLLDFEEIQPHLGGFWLDQYVLSTRYMSHQIKLTQLGNMTHCKR